MDESLNQGKNVIIDRTNMAKADRELFVEKESKLYVLHENGIRIALQRLVKELENVL